MSIDGRGSAHALAARQLLELHEDEVPDLDKAVAVLVGAARRAAGDALAVVVEDLRARPARAGIAHRPEIVRGRDADDALFRQPGDLRPQPRRVVVLGIDRDEQPVARQAELAHDQVPGQLDRALLEIVAEREIAEHLEKRVMPRGVADIFEIVVLAAGAHAFLRGRGALVRALLDAGEDVLELHHAGIGEQQGRVVARHQRARRHDLVPVPGEIIEKGGADVVGGLHGGDLWQAGCFAQEVKCGGVAAPALKNRTLELKGTAKSRARQPGSVSRPASASSLKPPILNTEA